MRLIQITEAADRLGVSRQTMTNWGKSGAIKLRKMGKTGNAYWVDADTIDAMADTMADIENTKKMLTQEQEELRQQYKEEHETLKDIRREVFMLKKFGEGVAVKEFYLSIPTMLHDLGVLVPREASIMMRMIKGDDIGWIAEDYGLTRARVSQIFFKGCRKARSLENLKATIDKAEKAQDELEYLRKKAKVDADYIKELEAKLEIKHKPQEEQDRELMMKRLVDCDLTVRTLNCLKAADLETVGDLLRVNRITLLQFRNFGKKSLIELDDFLESIGKEWGTKYLIPVYSEGREGYRGYIKGYRLSDTPAR
jgi:hypothetical protein